MDDLEVLRHIKSAKCMRDLDNGAHSVVGGIGHP